MSEHRDLAGRLIITADDWGYSERYNAGILEAVQAKAIDAVSAMVLRPACDSAALSGAGAEVGLHVERPEEVGPVELLEAPGRQADAFEHAFGRPPAYIDGHHHCHATPPLATAVEDVALELGIPVRAIGEDHRLRLLDRGIASANRVIGRDDEDEPPLPDLIAAAVEANELPPGTTEWVVHPGRADAGSGSGYDTGREQDLRMLLELAADEFLTSARTTHTAALR